MTLQVRVMDARSLSGQRVLVREDLNVPMHDGSVANDKRIRAALPTLKSLLEANAAVMVMSHLGRPAEGAPDPALSLQPVANVLADYLDVPVRLATNWLDGCEVAPGEIVLCENVRFNNGEKANDEALSRRMAALCDVFVMDAFGTAHRAQASTHGVAKYAPVACAGPLLVAELEALKQVVSAPARPMLAVVGGSKVSTKLTVLDTLVDQVEQLIVGGGIANTFIAAAGFNVGKSLYEASLVDEAKRLMSAASKRGAEIPIPTDVRVATEFSETAAAVTKPVDQVEPDELILDVGPQTERTFAALAAKAGTIVWNGPVGVFEFPAFAEGTRALALAIADSDAFSVAGGGDTLAAIDQFEIADRISYISTGGGAFLEFLEGKKLPALAVLEDRSQY